MNIAFIGDSFCGSNHELSWHHLVTAELGAHMLCQGQGGVSLWHSYQQLASHLDDVQLAVCCYTDAHRLANPQNYPINLGSVQYHRSGQADTHSVANFPNRAVWDAAAQYYDHLWVKDYHVLTWQLLIQHMDSLLSQRGVRTIHFFSFEHVPMTFNSGPCCDIGLWEWLQHCGKASIAHDTDENHMSWRQNRHMADTVSRLLCSNSMQSFGLGRVHYRQ
jgi:hypothetical protein